jgi:hypothetical protein
MIMVSTRPTNEAIEPRKSQLALRARSTALA